MPVRGRWMLLIAVVGFVVGAGPAVAARHGKARLIARKARAHGHIPARFGRPPLVGTLPGSSTTPEPPAATDPVPTTPAPACPTAIGVTEGEYYTQTSRSSLCPGSILMELRNAGQDDHDLKVLDVGQGTVVATWAIAHPGDTVQKRLTLPAGTYRLFCTLSDGNGSHDELGMHAVITVG